MLDQLTRNECMHLNVYMMTWHSFMGRKICEIKEHDVDRLNKIPLTNTKIRANMKMNAKKLIFPLQ